MNNQECSKSIDVESELPKCGFSRLKPLQQCIPADFFKYNRHNILTNAYKQLVLDQGPYFYFITLTFARNVGFNSICKFTGDYIHYHNKEIFNVKYRPQNKYIQGFAFLEDHPNKDFGDRIHIHLLIKCHSKFNEWDNFDSHTEIFHTAAKQVKDDNGRPVFNPGCIDIQRYRDSGAIAYCFKCIWDGNIDRVKFICKDGLSDNQSILW
ncbi:hypothetical protein [Pelobacter propionicus]|nr:hypothetical protein [Pelobacter propionicus]